MTGLATLTSGRANGDDRTCPLRRHDSGRLTADIVDSVEIDLPGSFPLCIGKIGQRAVFGWPYPGIGDDHIDAAKNLAGPGKERGDFARPGHIGRA